MEENQKLREHGARLRWLRRPTRNDVFWLIVSLIISLFLWVYIATTISGNYTVRFSEMPIVVDAENSRASGFGLSVLSPPSESVTVDVTVSGSRANIGGLNRDEIEAYVDFNANTVTNTVGQQELPVRLRYKNGTAITNCTLSVTALDVVMDKYTQKEVLVSEVDYPNLTGADSGVIIDGDSISISPSVVTITGPSTALEKLDHLRVRLEDSEELYQTKTFNSSGYDLIDADRAIVSDSVFQVQATQFTVTVPVYYIRKLPVTVALTDVPAGFDVSSVMQRLHIQTDQAYDLPQYGENNLEIIIETDTPQNRAKLDKYEYWELDTVSLHDLSLGGSWIELTPNVKEGFTIGSDLGTVYVSMDESNLVAETRWISNIEIINQPSGYECTVSSSRTRITIIGTPEEVAKVSASDIRATVDLFTADLDKGTFAQALTVTLPETVTGVWVSPIVKVYVTATQVAATTRTAYRSTP